MWKKIRNPFVMVKFVIIQYKIVIDNYNNYVTRQFWKGFWQLAVFFKLDILQLASFSTVNATKYSFENIAQVTKD